MAFSWITRFTSTAYPESATIVFVMAAAILTLKLAEKKSVAFIELMPLIAVIGAMALSKLNGAILVPSFITANAFILWKKSFPAKAILFFAVLAIFFSGFWFGANFLKFGEFDQHIGPDVYNVGEETGFSIGSVISNIYFYYLYFWDFPNQSAFSGNSFLHGFSFFNFAVLFTIITFPLFIILLFGAKKILGLKNHLTLLIFSAIILSFIPVVQRIAYYRLLIPVIPFFAIIFGFGFENLKGKIRAIVLVSLALFLLFSFFYTSISAYKFSENFNSNIPLYSKISELPQNSVVMIEANNQRDVEYIFGKKSLGVSSFTPEFLTSDESKFVALIKSSGVTNMAIVCGKNSLDANFLEKLSNHKVLDKTFENSCSKLFEVN